jgi:ribonuclease HI
MNKRTIRVCVDGGGGVGSSSFVYGVRIKDEDTGEILHTAFGMIEEEENTNNVAEYVAMKIGLELASLHRNNISRVVLQGDSQLVLNQLRGEWVCSKPHLLPYLTSCRRLVSDFGCYGIKVSIEWVPREENKDADELGHKARELFECQ